jgi:hypothetical protein
MAGEWERDEFRLPVKPEGEESAKARHWREAQMRRVAGMLLTLIFRKLHEGFGGKDGVEKARRCFDPFASKKTRYAKGQHGANYPEINEQLLGIYDRSDMGPAELGRELAKWDRGRFGASPEAIEKKLRRLLAQREAKGSGRPELCS